MSTCSPSFFGKPGYVVFALAMMIMFSVSISANAAWPNRTSFGSPTAMVQNVEKFVDDGAKSTRKVTYGIGGLGAVALGTMAMFGRFNWNWLFSMVGGLSLITLYGVGVNSITTENF